MKRESLPLKTLPAWAKLNGIILDGVAFRHIQSSENNNDTTGKGAAVVATQEKTSTGNGEPGSGRDSRAKILIKIPLDMVLSLEGVGNYAKSDRFLREVLEGVGDFGRVGSFFFFVSFFCILFL